MIIRDKNNYIWTEKELRVRLCFNSKIRFECIHGNWYVKDKDNEFRAPMFENNKDNILQWNKLVNDIIKAKVEINMLNMKNYGKPIYDVHVAYIGNIWNTAI